MSHLLLDLLHLKNKNMGQSLVKNYLHIVFSTKYRQRLIQPEWEDELYNYLGGICNNLDSTPIRIGGHFDHVHVLCILSKNISIAKLMQELKGSSSKWVKAQHPEIPNFYWQNGYGAFSVDHHHVEVVKNYIARQHEHHTVKTFQQEFKETLELNDMLFDERYVWD